MKHLHTLIRYRKFTLWTDHRILLHIIGENYYVVDNMSRLCYKAYSNLRISSFNSNCILSHFSILKRRKCFSQAVWNSIKISAAQLLFKNVINLDWHIFLPVKERQEYSKPPNLCRNIWCIIGPALRLPDCTLFRKVLWMWLQEITHVISCKILSHIKNKRNTISRIWNL